MNKIEEIDWTFVRVKKGLTSTIFKDVILCGSDYPISWDWKNTKWKVETSSLRKPLYHSPGIPLSTLDNLAELLYKYKQEKHMIISKGFEEELPIQILPSYENITFHHMETGYELVDLFNKLNNGEKSVCAILLHMTC